MPKTPKAEPVQVEWREPPPKIGRRRPPRPEEIKAGLRVRDMLIQSRRARGIPPEGIIYPGETPDIEKPYTRRKAPK